MAKGWFGNVMGGGGHDVPGLGSDMDDWRYQGAAMIGRFTDKSQISIILNGNNTNNRGFNDVAGSMMQNMRGDRGMGRGMGGWRGNNGISTSWMEVLMARSPFLMVIWTFLETIFTMVLISL